MTIPRRSFLTSTAVALSGVAAACAKAAEKPPADDAGAARNGGGAAEWAGIRSEFDLSPDVVHMSALLISSHPRRVRDAIEKHRREIDRNPVEYVTQQNRTLQGAARAAAAKYLDAGPDEIALTESTTMGLGLLYGGLRLSPGQEVLTTSNDYFATHEALRAASDRSGASIREIDLYEHGETVSAEEFVHRIVSGIGPHTRALALTWVHSSTGLRLPLPALAEALEPVNRERDENTRVLLCVDGVHGFGVEDTTVEDLGADFFAAGCHKWLFGPRGTGVLWGRKDRWPAVRPTIPSFTDGGVWQAWLEDRDPDGPTTAARVTPGGFKAFEHLWALPEAFDFHLEIGKARIARRTHLLAQQLKEGLARMPHVRLITPASEQLAAGIVCFDVEGMQPRAVVNRLRDRRVVATVTPYARMHVRLTPSIVNTEEEVEAALAAVRGLT